MQYNYNTLLWLGNKLWYFFHCNNDLEKNYFVPELDHIFWHSNRNIFFKLNILIITTSYNLWKIINIICQATLYPIVIVLRLRYYTAFSYTTLTHKSMINACLIMCLCILCTVINNERAVKLLRPTNKINGKHLYCLSKTKIIIGLSECIFGASIIIK